MLFLGSWVDPTSVDVYSGTLSYSDDQGYSVANLSGACQFFFEEYGSLALSSGALYNTDSSIIQGRILVNGTEYQCRLNAFGGLSIYQSYLYTSTTSSYRWAWISYNLIPDNGVPGSGSIDVLPFLFLLAFFMIIIIFGVKVVIK